MEMNFSRVKMLVKSDFVQILSICVTAASIYLVVAIGNAINGSPDREYFYRTNNQYVRAIVTPNPRYNDAKVLRFVHRVVSRCFSIDYESVKKLDDGDDNNNYFKCVNQYFAPLAASSLYANYPSNGHIEAVLASEANTYAILPFPPLIIARNKPDETFKWVVNVPITFTIQSVSSDQTTSISANFEITPMLGADNPSDLIITKVNFL